MRPTSPAPSPRRFAIAVAAATLLALPTAALAAPEDEPISASEDAARCPDHLVTLRPAGADGDDRAVGITAQTLDAERPGWAYATWQAAPGTRLTAIVATSADGSTARLPVAETGEASDVIALTFCGSVVADTGPAPSEAEPQPTSSDEVTATAVPTDRDVKGRETSDRPAPASDASGHRTPTEPSTASAIRSARADTGPNGPGARDQVEAASAAPTLRATAAANAPSSWWQRLPDSDRRAQPATVLAAAAPASADARSAEARPGGEAATGRLPIQREARTPAGGSNHPSALAWLLGGLAGVTAWLPFRYRRSTPLPTTTWG